MNNIRFKFIRGEEVKYISHLDMMKVFDRALRRSRIPVAYSQGFNPHPQMIFGLPLSVGVTSEAEYADFELAYALDPEEFAERLNSELPGGLRILAAKYRPGKANIMTSIDMATFNVMVASKVKMEISQFKEKIDKFLLEPSITVKKESKQGVKLIDIKPMIHKIEIIETDETNGLFCLSLLLSAGNTANLRPDLVAAALNEYTDLEVKFLKIHRTGLFVSKEGKLLDPMDPAILLEI